MLSDLPLTVQITHAFWSASNSVLIRSDLPITVQSTHGFWSASNTADCCLLTSFNSNCFLISPLKVSIAYMYVFIPCIDCGPMLRSQLVAGLQQYFKNKYDIIHYTCLYEERTKNHLRPNNILNLWTFLTSLIKKKKLEGCTVLQNNSNSCWKE
jgi:hypothetical protein